MTNIEEIQEDMTVVGSDGEHVGTVDKVEGDRIKLTKNDSPNAQHNYVSVDMVDSIEDDTVTLSQTAEDVKSEFDESDGATEVGSAAGGA